MKILAVGAVWFHADGRAEIHDKANSRFSQNCEKRLKTVLRTYAVHTSNARYFASVRNVCTSNFIISCPDSTRIT